MFKEAFAVGVVLSVKDMYSAALDRARTQIRAYSRVSEEEAAKFSARLKRYQTAVNVGATVSAAGIGISRLFEGAVRAAGEAETQIGRVYIAMGDRAETLRERVGGAFHEIKSTYGETDAAIGGALREIGNRTGDWEQALAALPSVAALAAAKQIDLGQATEMLTTLIQQNGDELGANLTTQERYTARANQLSLLLSRLGGNWEGMSQFMGNSAIKGKQAGQSFETMGAVLTALGQDAARLRTGGAAFTAILDSMLKIRELKDWDKHLTRFAKSGDFLDLLKDLAGVMEFLDTPAQRLGYLRELFGENADMVEYFLGKFGQMDAAKQKLGELRNETSTDSEVFRKAKEQTETWAGAMKQFRGRIEETKETIGIGLVPVVKGATGLLGGLLNRAEESPALKGLLTLAGSGVGVAGELAKYLAPIVTAIGYWKVQGIAKDVGSLLKGGGPITIPGGPVYVTGPGAGTPAAGAPAAGTGTLGAAGTGGLSAVAAGGLAVGATLGMFYLAYMADSKDKQEALRIHTALANGEALSARDQRLASRLERTYSGIFDDVRPAFNSAVAFENRIAGVQAYETFNLPGAQTGTPTPVQHAVGGYIPETGLALLHAGERVVPAAQVRGERGGVTIGSITIQPVVQGRGYLMQDVQAIAGAVAAELRKRLEREARCWA